MPKDYFVTLNCHVNDIQLFEDLITITIPKIESHPSYSWVVEKDDTPNRHFHAYVGGKEYRDNDKLKQHLINKKWKDAIKLSNTKEGVYLQVKSCNTGSIGYIYKDIDVRRRNGNLDQTEVTEAVERYHAQRRIEAATPLTYDEILITPKNIHAYYKLEKSKDPSITPENYQWKMTVKNYSFLNISQKQTKLFTQERRLKENQTEANINAITDYQLDTYENTHSKMCELLDFIRYNVNPDEIPSNIRKLL